MVLAGDRHRTRYAMHDGVHIAYQVVGEGSVDVVLVPGWVSHLDLQWRVPGFASFVESLSSFARVVMFDKRGTGLSDPVASGLPFEERMRDLETVLDAAGVERAVLFGYSEGGPLAALFAASHPERVAALILYGTLASGAAVPHDARAVLYDSIAHWGEGTALPMFAPEMPDTPAAREGRGTLERAGASPGMASALLDAILAMDISAVLPAIRVPTVVAHRSGDWLPIEHARQVASAIPGALFAELTGSNHAPWQGDSDSVVALVQEAATGSRRAVSPDRVLKTVMFTDIVGSTERAASLGDQRWTHLLTLHRDVVRSFVEQGGGLEVATTGDGFVVLFDGPARALRCARQMILGVQELGLEIRIGVHVGEIEVRDGDVAGIVVHTAARVAAAAAPNEVLASRTVVDLVAGSGIEFEDRGEHDLKGVPGAWRLFAVDG